MQPINDLDVCFFQETEIDILATVQNLLRQCAQPSAFLRPLSKLFSVIHNKLPRQALTNVFQVQQRTKQNIMFSQLSPAVGVNGLKMNVC